MPAGTHDPPREEFAHANAQAGQQVGRKHPAFPARWFDGLCALSPEPSSFWPPSPRELAMSRDPVEPRPISARLDRSNDGQDHALSPYAAARLRPRASPDLSAVRPHAVGTSRGSSRPGPTSHARRCRVHRTPTHVRDDVRSPLSLGRDARWIPQFRISVKWNIFAGED